MPILSRCFLVLYISCFDNHFNCYRTSVQGYDNATKPNTIYHFQVVNFTEKCYCIVSDGVLFFSRKYIFVYCLCHEPNPLVFTQIKLPINSVLVLVKKKDKIVGFLHVKILISTSWARRRNLRGVKGDFDKTQERNKFHLKMKMHLEYLCHVLYPYQRCSRKLSVGNWLKLKQKHYQVLTMASGKLWSLR